MCRKRLAELRDIKLFTPPDGSHEGDCPICCLPLPLVAKKSTFLSCCSKTICRGCNYSNKRREFEAGLEERCAFCREIAPETVEEAIQHNMKRVKKNDPAAMCHMGNKRRDAGDYETAFEYWTKAAELGDASAHYSLSVRYHKGEGVEKDMKKEIYHLEEAAIGGHPQARHNLVFFEQNSGRFERARKHYIIAANLGLHNSLTGLKILYAEGHASKEDYADALRAYQAAVNAAKSAEREEAEEFLRNNS
jgi:TPR repeat protein